MTGVDPKRVAALAEESPRVLVSHGDPEAASAEAKKLLEVQALMCASQEGGCVESSLME